MHELSIAVNLIDIAVDHAQEAEARKIRRIEVEIGHLAGVVTEALEFCFSAACKDTIAEDAELDIISLPALGSCEECQHEFVLDSLFAPCPSCDSLRVAVKQGKELRIKSILVD